MKNFKVNELRKMYLEFFESKGHLSMNSFSLVPHNDNSLLLINAGMAPLKPYFTGIETPPRKRVTTCQKCVRTGDIDNVGKTARHLTFFEMLGNFSFGDYFKHEAIAWSWEFLTETIGMDPDRLYPSIYGEDDEAFEIWNKEIGIPAEKITRFYRDPVTGECDNFWEHGAGPCGPCSEIYYDRGIKYGCGKPDCKVGCDCDRFMEVWNNVFTQFDGDGKGGYTELANKNIDTGMGLERLAVVVQDVDSVFDIDTMKAIRDRICKLAKVTYQTDEAKDVSIRLITDHIRSSTFLISDGVTPTNEGRGYVLRRLIRRAALHGRKLGINGEFLATLSQTVIDECKDGYPELEEKRAYILKTLEQEEKAFNKTIDQGLDILARYTAKMDKEGLTELDGAHAFKLYDTFGFPLDLTVDIMSEKGYTIDIDGFNAAMKKQKETARSARKVTNYMGADATVFEKVDLSIQSKFIGYDKFINSSPITVLTVDRVEGEGDSAKTVSEFTDILGEGQNGTIVVPETVFYATMGGQINDTGLIRTETGEFRVHNVTKLVGNKIGHSGTVISGMIKKGDLATLVVEAARRQAICKNHSATHLLQKALRTVLGDHVEQKGSYQDAERTRFDFSYNEAMTKEQLDLVEKIVNSKIAEDLAVETVVTSVEEAKKSGAMALFGEKYGDSVRVVSMGDFSKELCGGTHVSHTGEIGSFKILSEGGVAAGTRRIEAITGANVLAYYKKVEKELNEAAALVKATPANLLERLAKMQAEIKSLSSELEAMKSKAAKDAVGDVTDKAIDVAGVSLVAANIPSIDMNGLRDLADQMKEKFEVGAFVLASEVDGKVNLVVSVTDAAIKKGVHAGNLIKQLAPIVGGGGGGRPNMAQAGGKNPSSIDELIEKTPKILEEML